MATSAPAAMAFARSPEYLIPPSAIHGTPALRQASEASIIAVNCGTPTPATIRVVQIDPGPIPIFTASAPALIKASAPSLVAILPAMICKSLLISRIRLTAFSTPSEWPWAVSTTTTSTPASARASARMTPSSPAPMAAPTSKRPDESFAASG